MADKFLRNLVFNTGSSTARVHYFLKVMYEFWGFCVFGGASATAPGTGAFAATTPTGGSLPGNFLGVATTIAAGSNGASLPQTTINVASTTGFPTSGTFYLMSNQGNQLITYTGLNATQFTGCTGGTGTMSTGGQVTSASLPTFGTDGYTNATTVFRMDGYTDFFSTSGKFRSDMIGKQLVMWKPGSNSSEDSIYNIIGYRDPNNIIININTGGTPSGAADGYKPTVTTRSSINFRVIDIGSAGGTSVADGNFIVFQLDPTGINTGQANPQIQFLAAVTGTRIDYRMSPNGSWSGTAFGVDASAVTAPNTVSGGGTNTNQLQNTVSSGTLAITIIADKSFMLGWAKDSAHTSTDGFHWHFEIPERLYTQAQDPNPFTASINAYRSNGHGQFGANQGNNGYSGGFVMRDNGGTFRNHLTLSKALAGDGNDTFSTYGFADITGPSLTNLTASITPSLGYVIASPGLLSLMNVINQYSLARARLRKVRFTNTALPLFSRFSSGGDWLQVTQGVAIPWDKTVLPFTLFPF